MAVLHCLLLVAKEGHVDWSLLLLLWQWLPPLEEALLRFDLPAESGPHWRPRLLASVSHQIRGAAFEAHMNRWDLRPGLGGPAMNYLCRDSLSPVGRGMAAGLALAGKVASHYEAL